MVKQGFPNVSISHTVEEGFVHKPRQTVVVAFWGKWANGRPLRLCSRRIDKGVPGQ